MSFKDVYSLDTYTIQGIKNMLQLNANNNENSIISVLKNLGFKTYWLSAQPSTYEVDDLAYESDVVIPKQKVSNSPLNDLFDEDLLKPLQDILNKTSNDENLLIVLHTYGSPQSMMIDILKILKNLVQHVAL